jgi:hypothetical protein
MSCTDPLSHFPMSSDDLTELMRNWPHEPGAVNVRRITGNDGRPKIQIRVDLGVLQMEFDGRPDGEKPHGFDSLLDYQQDRLSRYIQENGSSVGFVLSSDECAAIRAEAVQFYHRYVGLFALREFARVIGDTLRSIAIFDLCRDFGETNRDRTVLEQFRPQVISMRVRSEAEAAIGANRSKDALAALDQGLEELRQVYEEAGMARQYDRANEVQLLRGMRDMLVPKLPASQKAELMERLRAAIDAENYELAAILRDELKMMP